MLYREELINEDADLDYNDTSSDEDESTGPDERFQSVLDELFEEPWSPPEFSDIERSERKGNDDGSNVAEEEELASNIDDDERKIEATDNQGTFTVFHTSKKAKLSYPFLIAISISIQCQ